MNTDNWPRRGRWALLLVLFCVAGWWAISGCDREEKTEDDEEVSETESAAEQDGDETASPYSELDGVEPIEATDVGPEGDGIYFLSGLKGYTEPCGCTVDVLLGGIDRITAFVKDARQLHPTAYFVDAGDWLFESATIPDHLEPQERAKAEVLAAAYRRMGASFSVPGDRDLALGVEFYRSMMNEAQMEPIGANLTLDGETLAPTHTVEMGGGTVLFVGVGDPENYEDIDGVEATDEVAAVAEAIDGHDADAVVVVYQGSPLRAEAIVEEFEGVDFVVVGHDPRLDDDARQFGSTYLLETYDQGRYVGRLKLYGLGSDGDFVDGRAGVREQRETIDRQIDQVRRDLRLLEVRLAGDESPMAERLEDRLADLQARRGDLMRDGIEILPERAAFLFEPIPMEPGYRLDDEIYERREDYNRSLADLNADIDRDVIEVRPGEPTYVGTAECATCHVEAHQFWEETAHSSAVATLEERHKDYDQNCIGCHVVGWEKPGGSVLGKLIYEDELNGEVFTKDLREVGCESCHGAGSKHRLQPLDEQGQPQHIDRRPDENNCMQCHVPDHSPTFDFDVYVNQITGEGHEYSGGQ